MATPLYYAAWMHDMEASLSLQLSLLVTSRCNIAISIERRMQKGIFGSRNLKESKRWQQVTLWPDG